MLNVNSYMSDYNLLSPKVILEMSNPIAASLSAQLFLDKTRMTIFGEGTISGEALKTHLPSEVQSLLTGAGGSFKAEISLPRGKSGEATTVNSYALVKVAPSIDASELVVTGSAQVLVSLKGASANGKGTWTAKVEDFKGCMQVTVPSLGLTASKSAKLVFTKAPTSNFAFEARASTTFSVDASDINLGTIELPTRVRYLSADKSIAILGRTASGGIQWSAPGTSIKIGVKIRSSFEKQAGAPAEMGFDLVGCTNKAALPLNIFPGMAKPTASLRASASWKKGAKINWDVEGEVFADLPSLIKSSTLQASVSSAKGIEVKGGALVAVVLAGVADPIMITLDAKYTPNDGFSAQATMKFPITPPEWGLAKANVEVTYDSSKGIWARASLQDKFDLRSLLPSASFVPFLDFRAEVETGGTMSMTAGTEYTLPTFLDSKKMELVASITETGMTIYGKVATQVIAADLGESIGKLELVNVEIIAYAPLGQ